MAAATVVLGVIVAPAAATACAWSRLYARENVRTVAGEWIAANVPAGARMGMTKWPWQFEMPPIDTARYPLVVMEDSPDGSPYDLARLMQLKPDYFVTSSLQHGNIRRLGETETEAGRFWRFLLIEGTLYRVSREFRAPLSVLGWTLDLSRCPEDMRYVNPEVLVLELSLREAKRLRIGDCGLRIGGPGPDAAASGLQSAIRIPHSAIPDPEGRERPR